MDARARGLGELLRPHPRAPQAAEPAQCLRIDPAASDGIGVYAHLAPGLVDLDRRCFPLIADGALTKPETAAAERAVRGCPRHALRLADVEARTDEVRNGLDGARAREPQPTPSCTASRRSRGLRSSRAAIRRCARRCSPS